MSQGGLDDINEGVPVCVSWCSAPSLSNVRDVRKHTHATDSGFRRIHLARELLIVTALACTRNRLSPSRLLGDAPRVFFFFFFYVSTARHPGIFSLEAEEKQTQLFVFLRSEGGGGGGGERSGADRLQIQLILREADGATPLSPL